jgi:anti-sigma-K factor RskA
MNDSCSQTVKRLEKYFDGEMTEDERNLVEDHLLECQACRVELNSLKELHTLIATPVNEAARREDFPWVWQKIEKCIRTQEKPSRLESLRQWLDLSPFLRRRVWVPALAVALLVMVVTSPFVLKKTSSPSATSIVVYVESQTNNVMVYESETDQEDVAVIWLFEGPDEESSTS